MFTLIFLFLYLNVSLPVYSFIHPGCYWRIKEYGHKNRDLDTGCLFSLSTVPKGKEYYKYLLNIQKSSEHYKYALVLAFSMDEVNQNPDLLPNKSLIFDFQLHDCMTEKKLYNVIQLWEKYYDDIAPNYICYEGTTCGVLLSGPYWSTSSIISKFMDIYFYQQVVIITYGQFHPILNDHEQFPNVYQMAPKDTSLAVAMVSLILHFSWNWIGLAMSDNDQSIQFLSYLRREMETNAVCFAFVNMIPVNMHLYMSRAEMYYNQIMTSSTSVVIIFGDTDSTLVLSVIMWESRGIHKIWVTTSQWDVTTSKKDFTLDKAHGTLTFAQYHGEISGLKNFLQTLDPDKYSHEVLARLEWMNINCEVAASKCKTLRNCSNNAPLEWLMEESFDMVFSEGSYDIYNAVYTVAHAFHEMFLQSVDNVKGPGHIHDRMIPVFQMHLFPRKSHLTNNAGKRVNMNQKESQQPEYDIFQIWNFPNGLGFKVKIGSFSPYFPYGQQLYLYDDMIEWATGSRQMPPSVCSADCGPGFRKLWQEGMSACCFDCSQCLENEVSNETNVDQCVKCPEDMYANADHSQCFQKSVTFLSYEDPLGMVLALISLCFSAFTSVILGVFVKHRDTPIVKANNRNLSYTLLISLIFCFLCPLLFMGHPNVATCILQQMIFGVLFTVAVSTVLAKTVTVLLAFKVTAPGRRMRYFLISGTPKYIVVICTLFQIFLCLIWLGFSPPSIDIDVHSEHGQVIIMCDKGSVTAFYCVLVYHGILAFGTFILAFLSRNLPDTFNEAKFLTFSMLLFCSVWVTFLPVYHSTKGKVMVAVEVFSILASSTGLLGCIFVPKCYIILIRPERNSLQKLKEKAPF
ncbi:vomeronasal type-2 receptor 116-like isoform X2 [Mesocricetus auratus]|uniref:Vomeronasal type-2 receptor 116-like isoform X2 n=1 Tax=Mesocricetus auratus TaxID=10036 RepID=A0ABM2WGM4_MESAU|nr:vomeronasal type-2 receptor 116-like isoform X2 [Mesocricetus auratus]